MKRQVLHFNVRNGVTLAYGVTFVNTLLGLLVAFGVHLTKAEDAALVAFINVTIAFLARLFNLPEVTPQGGVTRVAHVPVLEQIEPPTAPPTPVETVAALPEVTAVSPAPPVPFPQAPPQ